MDTIDVTARYSEVVITTPAKTAVQNTTISLANAYVDALTVLFPVGHAALTGFRLQYAGNSLIPWNGVGTWIVGDGERIPFIVGMYMPGVITLGSKNDDTIAHTLFVTVQWHTYTEAAPMTALSVPTVLG